MLKWELKKLCTRFTVVSIIILLILNLASVLILYGGEGTDTGKQIREARAELLDIYHNDHASYDALYEDYEMRNAEYEHWLKFGEGDYIWVNKLIDLDGYGDRQLWSDVRSEIIRAENYSTDIEKVLREAYARLKELGERRGEYTYEYQVNLILRYEKLADMQIAAQDVLGWNEYFSLVSPIIFLSISVILIGVQLFLNEKQARFTAILHVCRYGEARTRLAKIGALFFATAVLTALFTLLPFVILHFTTGLSDSGQMIQALGNFEYCHLELTILQYLLLSFAARVIVFFALALVSAVLGQISGSFVITVGSMLVFLAVNAVLPAGFFTAAFVNCLFERYRAVNFFGIHVPAIMFCALIVAFTVITAFTAAMLLKINLREYLPVEKIKKILSHTKNSAVPQKAAAVSTHHHTLLMWELKKTVLNPWSILLLLVLFFVRFLIQDSYFTPALSDDTVVYNNYVADITELGGTTEDAAPYIAEEAEYIAKVASEYNEALVLYRENRLSTEEYNEISSRYHYANRVSEGFGKLLERQGYLQHMSKQYENIGYVDEDGVNKLLSPDFDVIFVFVILLLISNLFTSEYQSGFAAIQRLTRFGRRETHRSKYLAAILTVSAVWLIFTAVDLCMLFCRFPMNGMSFGILSMQDMNGVGLNIPVWVYVLLCKICGFIGSILLTVLSAGISAITGQNLKSAMILFVIFLAPYLLSVFGMTLFDTVNINHLLYPRLSGGLSRLIVYLLAGVILYTVGSRRWNGTRNGGVYEITY